MICVAVIFLQHGAYPDMDGNSARVPDGSITFQAEMLTWCRNRDAINVTLALRLRVELALKDPLPS